MAIGLAGGEHGGGVAGRPDQRGQPAGQVVAGQAVPGQLGRRGRAVLAVGVGLGQQARVGGVEAGPLARQQVAVDGLLEQGVAEPVALGGGAGHQHLSTMASRRPCSTSASGHPEAATSSSWPTRRPATAATLRISWASSGQGLDAAQEHVGQGVGQGDVGPDGPGRDQLLGEERVALGAGQDAVDHGHGTGWPATAWRVLGQLDPAEGQLDPLRRRTSSASSGRSGWRRCSSSER